MMSNSQIRKLSDLLLVNVPPDLTDREVIELRREVLRGIRTHGCRWVVLDFSEVLICDSFFGRFVHGTAQMARLMGTNVIVCGLHDAVVEILVEMGFDLRDVNAVIDVDAALALSREFEAAQEAPPECDPGLAPEESVQAIAEE
jgi:rsbT antagonist protein RsbS